MTVRELIEQLEDYADELEVQIGVTNFAGRVNIIDSDIVVDLVAGVVQITVEH